MPPPWHPVPLLVETLENVEIGGDTELKGKELEGQTIQLEVIS
jgi:hypothetical protein